MGERSAHLNGMKDVARMRGGLVLHVAFLSGNLLLFHSFSPSVSSSTDCKIRLEENLHFFHFSFPPSLPLFFFPLIWREGGKESFINRGFIPYSLSLANPNANILH